MSDRICPVCQTPHQRKGIYCSRKCCRRVSNAKARGTQVRPPVIAFDCAQCGTRCIPGQNVVAHASKFCGRQCLAVWHKRHVEGRQRRRDRAQRLLASAAIGQPSSITRWVAGSCVICSAPFVSKYHDTITCSDLCTAKRKRDHTRGHRARARLYGVEYQPLNAERVFVRDSYRCGLCGAQTEPLAAVPHPRAPTLDHILPLSRGGPHLYSNVQCACFECNSRKGNDVNGQLHFAA